MSDIHAASIKAAVPFHVSGVGDVVLLQRTAKRRLLIWWESVDKTGRLAQGMLTGPGTGCEGTGVGAQEAMTVAVYF